MKKILLSTLLATFSAAASAAGYNGVIVTHADGSATAIALEERMTTRIANSNLVMECDKGSITIPVSSVRSFRFSTSGGNTPWTSGIAPTEAAAEASVALEADRLAVRNLPAGAQVTVVTVSGALVATAPENHGEALLPLSRFTPGETYIVAFNGKSVKLLINR